MRHHQVGEEDEHAARHHRIRRSLAHVDGAALDRIAEEGRHAGDDEGKDYGLDDAHPHIPFDEHILQAVLQVYGIHHLAKPAGAEGAYDACKDAENHQDGDHCHHGRYLGEDEEVGGVDAHDFQRVYLLRHAHRAQLRGDVGAHLACQDKTHDGRGELQQHDFARHVAHRPTGHPRALDVQLDLYGDDRADEKRYQQHDADGIDAQLGHLRAVLPEEHVHPFGPRESAPHQHDIPAYGFECFVHNL